MAVAFDVASESHTGTAGSTAQASFTWNHVGGASARGALVFVFSALNATHYVTSVTYGGVTMTAVPYDASTSSAEPGTVRAYYLDNCGTGTKAVVVNRTNNATIMYAVCNTVTAASATEVYLPGVMTQGGATSNTAASSSGSTSTAAAGLESVDDGSPGSDSQRFMGQWYAANGALAAGTGSTAGPTIDFGAYNIAAYHETTPGQGARNVGSAAGTDDLALVALAVRETPAANVTSLPTAAAMSTSMGTPAVVRPVVSQPTAGAVTATGATPSVVVAANVVSLPSAGSLTVTGGTPTVAVTANVLSQPGGASMTATGSTPAVLAPRLALPGGASLTASGVAPPIALSIFSRPTAASLTATGSPPAIVLPVVSLPSAASLAASGATPTVAAGGTQSRQPTAAALTATGAVPTVVVISGVIAAPSAATLAATGSVPTVALTDNWALTPGVVALTLALFVPVVTATASALAGRTLDQHGDPIASCTVDAFTSATNVFYGTATSDSAGRYSIAVLPGVEYFLIAYKGDEVFGASARDLIAA